MATSVVPQIADVVINIQEIIPVPAIGYGNLLIMTEQPTASATAGSAVAGQSTVATSSAPDDSIASSTGGNYKEYTSLDDVAVDYDESSATYIKAKGYFDQSNHGNYLMIVQYPKNKASDTLADFFWNGWYFAVLDNYDADVATELANMFEANAGKFLLLQVEDYKTLQTLGSQNYTIGLQHPANEPLDAGLVGSVASLTVGSQTWKFKNVAGVTPQKYNNTDFTAMKKAHVIVYFTTTGSSVGETSEGFTLSGEYIDNLHGEIWIKVEMRNRIQARLQDPTTGKISYDKVGIDILEQIVRDVLSDAWNNGIILTGTDGKGAYDTSFGTREQQSTTDILARAYNGGTFWYTRSGAIHDVTINGSVMN
ncbi:MAG: DUF3383 family protein [Lentilactobacillus sunkii]|jgi:hypothetical protein|uniref:DUF3383 family protein n=1 Tax=Lentilactobacillus sunkii TaxID=481719 RepID=UPI002F3509EF